MYDDFAHHPTAFEATIAGLRRRVGRSRIVAVFEPRSNTMKSGAMQSRLAKSLEGADLVYCLAGGLGWDPGEALAPLSSRAAIYAEFDPMLESLLRVLRAGDHVLVMSNGGFWRHPRKAARGARRERRRVMAVLAYRIVNVFTRGASLSGNPLCVFEDASALDDGTMQALARQFNLSETTFILPSDRATARVRIFTPSYEMPFAGHPTLGTAHVVRSLANAGDSLTLEMRAGVIAVTATEDRWTLRANTPRWREVSESRAALAEILGLEEGDLLERPLWVNTGKEQLVVPVASPEAVRRARPRADAFSV